MSNTLLRSDLVTEMIRINLKNNLTFNKTINRIWEKEFDQPKYKTGDTINARMPVQFKGSNGDVAAIEAVNEKSVPIVITDHPNVRIEFRSVDLTLTVDELNKRYFKPAMITIANKVDTLIASKTKDFYYFFGTPGAKINSFATVNKVRVEMSSRGIPIDNRYLVLDYSTAADFSSSMVDYNNRRLNTEISIKGTVGNIAGFDCFESGHTLKHISGVGGTGGTPPTGFKYGGQIKTEVTSGNTIVIKDLPADTSNVFRKDDVIYNTGSYIVNQHDHLAISTNAQFRVLADADSVGTEATITVAPSIISDITDAYQNIDVPLAVDSIMYLANDHIVNLAYHPDAIVAVSPKEEALWDDGHKTSYVKELDSGIWIRISYESDQANNVNAMRIDCMLGEHVFPQLGMRVLS